MAAKRKKSSAKSSKAAMTTAKRQLTSVILFAVAVFFLCVAFIEGKNVWLWLHNTLFGVFGVTAYFYPLLLGATAVVFAMDKVEASKIAKIVEAGLLGFFVETAIDIFSKHPADTVKYGEYIVEAFKRGSELKGGGAVGALLGYPLYEGFGKAGAIATVLLLIFVVFMILSGTTLIALFKFISRSYKNISARAESAYQAKLERDEKQQQKDDRKPRIIKGFNVDIPVDDMSEPPKEQEEQLTPQQKKVINTYYGKADTSEVPDGADDREKMSDALKQAAEDAEKVDVKEETQKFTEELENNKDKDAGYVFPPLSLLKAASVTSAAAAAGSEAMAQHLVDTLRSFGVETRIVNISRGPTVTRYELQPCAGVKISKITNLADDIALNLATAGVRIEAPIPNKAAVGIEVPNKSSDVVGVRGIFESPAFTSARSKLTIALGRDIGGNAVVTDIAKMPHGLIAGATGSGKSVCINSIIMSILYKATPEEVQLLMIDPKVVELGIYNGIPHLMVPVVTDPRKASGALSWAVTEMERRYKMFADRGVRDLEGYNRFVEGLEDTEIKKLPQIVIIIDELADLMMTAPNEVEDSINRIAAKARAAGMHLIIATQRPSVDVVTGVIKANIPTRIAFAVSSQVDSRTILDSAGAEKLLGRGDMLFSPIGSTKPNRIQGCYVSDEEVEAVVDFIKSDRTAQYDDNIMVEIERQAAVDKKQKTGLAEDGPEEDPMLMDAIKVVVENGQASTSLLQRKLKLGYARAARIVDEMFERGVVGPYDGPRPRKVLITKEQLLEMEAKGEE